MYGKVFNTIYDGTLYGHWEAIVTMQQLIVLATPEGIVDMTPHAIAARTSIPLEIIEKGIGFLAQPDPYSRTPGDDGKRIVLLDTHRPWGWKLVNHGKYTRLRNMEQKREADRVRISDKRNKNRHVATESQGVANVAHSDSDSDSNKSSSAESLRASPPFITIPLVGEEGEYVVTEEQVVTWSKSFPGIDVRQKLRFIREWNLSNPRRRKTRRGVLAHITTWLARDQDKRPNAAPPAVRPVEKICREDMGRGQICGMPADFTNRCEGHRHKHMERSKRPMPEGTRAALAGVLKKAAP